MFKILGAKTILTLLALILVTGGSGYGLYNYLMPLRQQKDQELASLKSAIEERRREVARLKEEYVMLEQQLRVFKELEVQGFFNNQNRVNAQESIENLRVVSNLIKTRFDISSGEMVADPVAAESNHVVLKSPVKIEVDSLDDVDVYTFIKGLQEKFPGSVDIVSVKLDRKTNISAPILRQIGSGSPVQMVTASVGFDWRTMAPKDRLDEFDTTTSVGSQGREAEKPAETAPGPGTVPPATPVVPPSPAPVTPAGGQ